MGRKPKSLIAIALLSLLALGRGSIQAQPPGPGPMRRGPEFKGARERWSSMSPEDRQAFRRNAERWMQMSAGERNLMRDRERLHREQLRREADAALRDAGLRLDQQSTSSAGSLWLIIPIVAFGPLLLELHGSYNFPSAKSPLKSLWKIFEALLWLGGSVATCAIVFRLDISSPSILIWFPIISAGLLLIKARVIYGYQHSHLARQNRTKAILASSSERISRFTDEQLAEIDIVEWIDISRQPVSDLVDAIHRHSVGRVIFPTADTTELRQLKEAIAVCEIEGVEAWLMVDFIQTSIARPAFDV